MTVVFMPVGRRSSAPAPSSDGASSSAAALTVSSDSARFGAPRRRAIAAALVLVFLVARGLGVGFEQRLPVGDGDLVVIGVDFAEGEESVPVAAIFDEGGLQGRFDPGDFREVDVASQLFPASGLEVEFFDLLTTHHHDPGFLRV